MAETTELTKSSKPSDKSSEKSGIKNGAKNGTKSTDASEFPTWVEEKVRDDFRRWGYLQCELDPLGRIKPFKQRDLESAPPALAEKWRQVYCGKIGVEFMHMPFAERCDWIAEKMEQPAEKADKKFILDRILSTEVFEKYIHTRYVGTKRFSLDGVAALIPLLDAVLEQAADNGVETAMMAMAHRGRLDVIYQIACATAANIFAAFEDVDPKSSLGRGDVKYHIGATGVYNTRTKKQLKIHLASNPSHLEAVDPVIMGRARARQVRLGNTDGSKVLPLLMHGDAAFAGQGIAAESLNFAELPGFFVGGTVHIIINNLIGFTATPEVLHSSRYCTDIAKRLAIPIFHVNADCPEEVYRVGKIAMEYRAKFKSDVVIDLVGYRRYGHNEGDDPTTTSPSTYDKIKGHPLLYQLYAAASGVSEQEVTAMEQAVITGLKEEHEKGRAMTKRPSFYKLPDYWNQFVGGPYSRSYEVQTSVPQSNIDAVTATVTSYPADFNIHPKVKNLLEQRKLMGKGEKLIDWGMAEALAFGTLVMDGVPVRLTGQDSRRGTFSHRHSVLVDYKDESREHCPLQSLGAGKAKFEVLDSMLSEAAAVGFEYGYTRDFPEALVMWEAQFGDFVNGAQIIIDQFIAAGEDKWGLLSGLTMLLPHGFEGGGAEHSSARIERFLQLCAEDNMQVCYPSTAAQQFHLLRRQALRKWKKPLIIFTPKSMLRAAAASSPVEDFTGGSFLPVIDDADEFKNAERLLVCSGKIAHELRAERKKREDNSVAIITIEQFYPFPEEELREVLLQYQKAGHVVWVQEEPSNMGAMFYMKPKLDALSGGRKVSTIRRSESASPATGSPKAHTYEQQALLNLAFAKYS
jgi:2-oxoglutarate dehydrogenase E1 component